MANPRRTIKNIDVKSSVINVATNRVNVELYYSKGGHNYFSGKEEPRGYWLSVTPQELSGHFVTTVAASGRKLFMEEKKRFSQKNFDNFAVADETLEQMVNVVMNENHLEFSEE